MKTVVDHITFANGESDIHKSLLKDARWTRSDTGEWRKKFLDEAAADSETSEMLKSLRDAGPCTVSSGRRTLKVTEGSGTLPRVGRR